MKTPATAHLTIKVLVDDRPALTEEYPTAMMKRGKLRQNEFTERLLPLRSHIMSYCRRLLWNEEVLEDTLQEVLTIAFEKYDHFESGAQFKSWMFKICTNVVFNANRKTAGDQDRFIRIVGDEHTLDIVAELQTEYAYEELLNNPEKILAHVGDEMQTALLSLSELERSVFLLKTISELTCKEIAETLKIPFGSAMAYLYRARVKLRVQLSEYAKQYGFLSGEVREECNDGLHDN